LISEKLFFTILREVAIEDLADEQQQSNVFSQVSISTFIQKQKHVLRASTLAAAQGFSTRKMLQEVSYQSRPLVPIHGSKK